MNKILLSKYTARYGDLLSLTGDIFINERKTIKYVKVTGDTIKFRIVNPYDYTYREFNTNDESNFTISASQFIGQEQYTYHAQVVVTAADGTIKFTTDPEVFEVV
uniref:Uncharacterized protein n=1 Tax=Nitrosopumivirus cobalaminus TaxID=3158414 RepID=A0AAU7N456_9VIRU